MRGEAQLRQLARATQTLLAKAAEAREANELAGGAVLPPLVLRMDDGTPDLVGDELVTPAPGRHVGGSVVRHQIVQPAGVPPHLVEVAHVATVSAPAALGGARAERRRRRVPARQEDDALVGNAQRRQRCGRAGQRRPADPRPFVHDEEQRIAPGGEALAERVPVHGSPVEGVTSGTDRVARDRAAFLLQASGHDGGERRADAPDAYAHGAGRAKLSSQSACGLEIALRVEAVLGEAFGHAELHGRRKRQCPGGPEAAPQLGAASGDAIGVSAP
jgi:hypothetical protein